MWLLMDCENVEPYWGSAKFYEYFNVSIFWEISFAFTFKIHISHHFSPISPYRKIIFFNELPRCTVPNELKTLSFLRADK